MKAQKRIKKVKPAKAASNPAQDVESKPIMPGHVTRLEIPPPDYLLDEAMREPDRKLLEEYGQVIRLLRDEKRFTFREIAEWLKQYGFGVDHNAVYREYTRGLSVADERIVEMQDAEEQHEEK